MDGGTPSLRWTWTGARLLLQPPHAHYPSPPQLESPVRGAHALEAARAELPTSPPAAASFDGTASMSLLHGVAAGWRQRAEPLVAAGASPSAGGAHGRAEAGGVDHPRDGGGYFARWLEALDAGGALPAPPKGLAGPTLAEY